MNNDIWRGISFVMAITIIFVALKLFGEITFSWWWVLFPLWGTGVFSVILIFMGKISKK